jgi:TolB-like protein
MSFFAELKRRNVVRVGLAYAVIGWLLAQIAEFAFENFGAPEWVLKSFVVVLLLGMPLALFFAWAFEMTPEGLRREKDIDRSESITHVTRRKLDYVIVITLVLAVIYFAWQQQVTDERPVNTATSDPVDHQPGKRSIAVLPFVNMSSDEEQEWFADGLTEELLNALARMPDLLVAARTSSFRFKGSDDDIPTIANALGVAHVLEGSVRKGKDRIRITAQLIRATDGFHLWSETYDSDLDDVIQIQENVAIEIARALETAMDPAALKRMASVGTASVPAYEAYLEALAFSARGVDTGNEDYFLRQMASLERARDLDPGFASAHWRTAFAWLTQMQVSSIGGVLTDDSPAERRKNYRDAIAKALATEKDDRRKIRYRAFDAWFELRLNDSLRLVDEYLALNPNDYDTLELKLGLLMDIGDHENAKQVAQQLARVGGDDPQSLQSAMSIMVFAGDTAGARTISEKALQRYPDNAFILYQAHRAFLWDGAVDEARPLVAAIEGKEMRLYNVELVRLRQACADKRSDVAEAVLARLEALAAIDANDSLWIPYHLVGQPAKADAQLMRYDDAELYYELLNHLSYPFFDPKSFPNFRALLERQGVPVKKPIPIPFACAAIGSDA